MLEEGIELSNGMVATLLVGKPRDASPLWDAVKDVRAQFFADHNGVNDRASFARWFERDVDYACIAIIDGEPAACAYVVALIPEDIAGYHAFAAPDFRNPQVTIPLAKMALDFFIERFELKKVETLGRMDNRIARLTAAKLGFQRDRVLEQHEVHDGELVYYYIGNIGIQ